MLLLHRSRIVSLAKGNSHAIAFASTSGWAPDLDAIEISPLPGSEGSEGTALVGAQPARCLGVGNNTITNGTQAQLWDCNGGANQTWEYTARRQLVVSGNQCLDANNGTTNGTAVIIWDCNGQSNQQWTSTPADGSSARSPGCTWTPAATAPPTARASSSGPVAQALTSGGPRTDREAGDSVGSSTKATLSHPARGRDLRERSLLLRRCSCILHSELMTSEHSQSITSRARSLRERLNQLSIEASAAAAEALGIFGDANDDIRSRWLTLELRGYQQHVDTRTLRQVLAVPEGHSLIAHVTAYRTQRGLDATPGRSNAEFRHFFIEPLGLLEAAKASVAASPGGSSLVLDFGPHPRDARYPTAGEFTRGVFDRIVEGFLAALHLQLKTWTT